MTELAVNKFVGMGIISDKFRNWLTTRQITHKDIAAVDPDLDEEDVNAMVLALMNTGDFPHFAAAIDGYINRRYRAGRAGDELPISV